MLKVTRGARGHHERSHHYHWRGSGKERVPCAGSHGQHYHQSRRPRRNYTSSIKTMTYAPESVGFQDLSLRHCNPLEHSPRAVVGTKHQGVAGFRRRPLDCGSGIVRSTGSLSAAFLWTFGLSVSGTDPYTTETHQKFSSIPQSDLISLTRHQIPRKILHICTGL